jgi:hypothetical protein
LVDSKDAWTYWHFLHFVIVLGDMKFNPSTVTTDFECGLLQAVREQFPEATRTGCLFHFKQALRRKLVKLKIPETQIYVAMERGMLDSLTTVRKDQISVKIAELRGIIPEMNHVHEWTLFYEYFVGTWMKKIEFKSWNISEAIDKGIDIQNRTNNALEDINHQINAEFPSPHPNIFHFV